MQDAPYDVRDKDAEIRAATSYVPRKSSRNGALIFNIVVFVLACAVVLGAGWLATGRVGVETVVLMLLAALLAVSSVHIALSWEKVVVLRFGKLARVVGPGLYLTIPIVEHGTIRVDQRTIATSFFAEKTLTADLVPVTVDAVLFWVVWDAEKACTEVEDYYAAVSFLAQTALRDAIGQVEIAELSMQRAHIDRQLKKNIEEKTEQWGVTIIDVEIRDIRMPQELQNAMSAEAQAQQERNARVVLAEVEKDISDMFIEAAHAYREDDLALQLRMMSLVNESVKEGGNMVVVPSPYAQGFTGDIASALKGKK